MRIPSDDWRLQERWINPAEYLHFVDVAGDGKAVVVGARGDVFHLALADKETLPRNLTGTPGVREDTPRLSPDGKQVAYFADATGEYQLYVRDVATGETTQVTTDLDRKVYHPRWSPDGQEDPRSATRTTRSTWWTSPRRSGRRSTSRATSTTTSSRGR